LVIGVVAGAIVTATTPKPASRPAVPATQYSPLAAQGGYEGQTTTWYDALFRSLNPRNIDWGLRWEQRRSVFLENSVGNKYFVYAAALSLLLIWLTVVVVWQRWDHVERLKALAQSTADVLNYATYWKQAGGEAIRRHNDHIERCNRVIEAGENGVPLGDVAEGLRLRRELEESRTEVLNLTTANKRLQSELDQKAGLIVDLSQRVDEVARKTGNGKGPQQSGQVASLVERINRLEEALKAARRENEVLKGA
jgi:DNA-binding transcriptional MerR regulator